MRWILGGASALVLALAADAGATAARVLQVPNGPVYNCGLCHLSPRGAGPRTLFGEDVRATLRGTVVDWPALCPIDSDRDGVSNGAELGDPDCTWRRGGEVTGPPTNPNDPQDFPVTPPDAGPIEDAAVDAAPADAAPAPDAMAQRLDAGPDAAPPADAGGGAGGGDMLVAVDAPESSEGGCRLSPRGASPWFALLLVLGLARRRRR